MSPITLVPPPTGDTRDEDPPPVLRITRWADPVADGLGVHPCSRYVELYWLGVVGPSATWLLRRLSYGLEVHEEGFDLHLADTARALGLGARLGRNSPFCRALGRLRVFDLARQAGPGGLAVRTVIPPLPLRHVQRLPSGLQRSHRRWIEERRLSEPEQMRRRAERLAAELAAAGKDRADIERRLSEWQFHPAVAYRAAERAAPAGRPREGPGTTPVDPNGGFGGRPPTGGPAAAPTPSSRAGTRAASPYR